MFAVGGMARIINPLFDASGARIAAEMARMRRAPVPLQRPLVILGGWRAVHATAHRLTERLALLTQGDAAPRLAVSFLRTGCVVEAARVAVEAVRRRWPSDDPASTIEVDVVGVSMGGIVARVAAAGLHDPGRGKRLRIARLWTLATPHRGARMARVAALDRVGGQLRARSSLLRAVDDALPAARYDICAYARLRDGMVGARNAALPGRGCRWIDGPPLLSHLTITREDAFAADIALALRGEPPLSTGESEPPRD